MKLAFLTTCQTEAQIELMLRSCRKYNIALRYFAFGKPCADWAHLKIEEPLVAFEKLLKEGFTHVLYSDSRDAFFTGGPEEIVLKYKAMGYPPCVVSAERACNPNDSYREHYPDPGTPYRFHNVGGYLALIPWMYGSFKRMVSYFNRSGDDAEIWQWGWSEGWFRPKIDSTCEIFQTNTGWEGEVLEVREGRLYNTITKTNPCVYHLPGGYTDPVRGKLEALLPWWNRIHPEMEVK